MSRSQVQIKNSLVDSITSRGVVSYTGGGSVLDEILGVFALGLAETERISERATKAGSLSDAAGIEIERLAADMDKKRTAVQRAAASLLDRSVVFRVSAGGPFSGLSGGMPAISVGSILKTKDGKQYRITSIPAGDLSLLTDIFVGVEALVSGEAGNAPPNSITIHPYSSYASTVTVTNLFSLSNGRERETDQQLATRLQEVWRARESGNEYSLSGKLNDMSIVGDYKILFNYRGIGNTTIVVQPKVGSASPNGVINSIESSLRTVMPVGSTLIVKNPDIKYVRFVLNVRMNAVLNATEKNILKTRLAQKIATSFNYLRIGIGVDLASLYEELMLTDSRITSLGLRPSIFDAVETRIIEDGYEFKELELSGFISAQEDELILLDPDNASEINIL